MREFLEFILRRLVEYPDDVIITQGQDGDCTFFLLSMRPGDVGKVIGRSGHTINAIRGVLAAVAERQGKRVAVDIVEPRGESGGEAPPASDPAPSGGVEQAG